MVVANKDPDATEDIALDWATRIGSDTISSSAWPVPSGITKDSDSKTDTTTTIRLSGGTAGQKYDLINRVTLSSSEIYDATLRVYVREE